MFSTSYLYFVWLYLYNGNTVYMLNLQSTFISLHIYHKFLNYNHLQSKVVSNSMFVLETLYYVFC